MSDERRRVSDQAHRVTPVVGGLLAVGAVVLLLLQTVLTAPLFTELLRFTPGQALERPWTFFSYIFAHSGPGHFAVTGLGLYLLGPSLEQRLGGRGFLLYYLYCGAGAALFSLGIGPLLSTTVPPFLGASGAVLGLAFAWGTLWPEREMRLFPLPLRLSARSLVILLASAAAVLGLVLDGGIAHIGNLGGLAAGYLFFRIQGFRESRTAREPKAVIRRPVMAPIPVRQGTPAAEIRPAMSAAPPAAELSPDALDRVLDKISASGLKSLTPAERQFLDEIAKRKRNDSQ